jgi:sensor c-di-GMP phosphodiesterase-like protein
LRNASIAAERSVGSALFGCRIFDDTMKEQILREIQIKDELMGLHPAGVNGCLYLQYQPILNLRTNRIYGFEALARMKTDALGVVSPWSSFL